MAAQMNAPLEKALLTLRPDLTLQMAVGARALDAQLSLEDAYGLALALLATVAELEPWKDRADAPVLAHVHGLAFMAAQLGLRTMRAPALSSEKQARVAVTLERAFTAVTLLEMSTASQPRETR
jgi:hypothetical protein